MTTDATPPIEVGLSAAPAQFAQAARTLLVALGGYAAGKGWIDSNIATALVPFLLVGLPFLWGQIAAVKSHAQRVTLADAAPADVANVVRP